MKLSLHSLIYTNTSLHWFDRHDPLGGDALRVRSGKNFIKNLLSYESAR